MLFLLILVLSLVAATVSGLTITRTYGRTYMHILTGSLFVIGWLGVSTVFYYSSSLAGSNEFASAFAGLVIVGLAGSLGLLFREH